MTGLIGLLIVLALIGVLAWALTTYVPMPPPIKGVIVVVCVVVAIFVALGAFGVVAGPLPVVRVR
jgi:hypothetical protein